MTVLRTALPKLLFESVLIVFSILLALSVSECSERSNRQERAEVALDNIRAEIASNAASLRRIVPYHQQMLARLDLLLADSASVLRSQGVIGTISRIAPEGLQPPTLGSTAWGIATTTDAISRIDYAQVYVLSRLYQIQHMGVETTVPRLSELLLARETFQTEQDPLPSLRLLQLILNELVTQEQFLLQRYTEVLGAND
ncbi:MAG: hypothetical protein H0V06_00820 [Gemmatimonadetes bacterium]|nr:hypothetical protein [Gemmatimonadota bacterium]